MNSLIKNIHRSLLFRFVFVHCMHSYARIFLVPVDAHLNSMQVDPELTLSGSCFFMHVLGVCRRVMRNCCLIFAYFAFGLHHFHGTLLRILFTICFRSSCKIVYMQFAQPCMLQHGLRCVLQLNHRAYFYIRQFCHEESFLNHNYFLLFSANFYR